MPDPMTETTARHCAGFAATAARYGVDVPDAFLEALAVARACAEYEIPAGEDLDLEALTATVDRLPGLIERRAHAARDRQHLRTARAELAERLARRVVREARAAAPAIIAALADPFTEAAAALTTTLAKLPTGWEDSAVLVEAGAGVVKTFATAREAAVTLNELRDLRDRLASELGVKAPGDPKVEAGTRYCHAVNTGTARRAAAVLRDAGPLSPWADLLATAGVDGLQWLGLDEHAAYLKALPVVENQYEESLTSGFKTVRMVEA